MSKKITVALAGNPNSGKTTIFNTLTGARQRVGNYPGVTVEKKEGFRRYKDYEITVVDLPGTYSLSAYSVEELVARNFIIDQHPDVVVDIVDASNIERNLYLATQLIEMNASLVLALNMSDIAQQMGLSFDLEQLSKLLEAPIIPTVGSKGKGAKKLLDAIIETAEAGRKQRIHKINFGTEIEEELAKLEMLVDKEHILVEKYGSRWLGLKLLEQDEDIIAKGHSEDVLAAAEASVKHLKSIFGDEPQFVIAERRYGFISGACQETVESTIEKRHDISDIIDTVLTSRLFGLPIFIALMYLVFLMTFALGEPLTTLLETFFAWTGGHITALWPQGAQSPLKSLLVDGIIGGVGGVIVFLPNILLLFLAIAVLEDTGYMARAAFIMDRTMHRIGLHGKSFIPMLIGFGCSVPAIMATRILENRRNRITTILVIPLMSCGARFPIYALIIPAFFSHKWQGPVLWLIYIIGIALAILAARCLRSTLFKGQADPFVMELPPYRIPTIKGTLIHTWQRGWMYLRKAGTIILGISIILWVLGSYPKPSEEALAGLSQQQAGAVRLENSIMGRAGRIIAPAVKPLGFDWKIATALIGALPAKEVFVSQLGIVYSIGQSGEQTEALREKLRADYTPLKAFCIMLFCLISAPCVITIVMTWRETGWWGWALLQFTGLTGLAYLLTFIVYQFGTLITG